MGTFVFRWPHPEAKEVYVTGTFDDWGMSEKLTKVGDTFEKEVTLPDASETIFYKFVVDEIWTTDHTAPQEDDGHHNINNVLKPEDIKKHKSHSADSAAAGVVGGATTGGMGAALLSSVHPDSTSAKLAGEVPKETQKSTPPAEDPTKEAPPLERKTSPPGTFPETPATEPGSFSVNPIPASTGANNPISVPAGEKLPDHQGVTGNTIDSHVTTSKEDYEKDASSALPEEKSFAVNPFPASTGPSNPISVPAGEKLPNNEGVTGNANDHHVTTSKEDYEKDASSDLPQEKSFGVDPIPASTGASNPVSIPAGGKLPDPEGITRNTIDSNVTTSKEDYEKDASSALPEDKSFGIDPIPASAGIGNPVQVPAGESVKKHKSFLPSSLYATATTSKEDYEKAGSGSMPLGAASDGAAEPNDSAFSVPEKTKDMIPESSLPMSGESKDTIGTGPFIQSSGPGTISAALAGQVPLEPRSKATVVEDGLPSAEVSDTKDTAQTSPLVQSSGPGTTTAALAGQVPLEAKSKATVVEPPSATAGSAQDSAKPSPFVQSSGPNTTTAALAGQVPLETRSKAAVMDDETPSATLSGPAPGVPEVVKDSLSQAHQSPEAAASPEAVAEKKEVENELLKEVKSIDTAGEPATTTTAALSATAPSTTAADSKALEPAKGLEKPVEQARETPIDISPIGKDANAIAPAPSSPVVTTGVGESKTSTVSTPQKPTTPASSAASSPADTSSAAKDKKKKRISFFGKLKEKLKG